MVGEWHLGPLMERRRGGWDPQVSSKLSDRLLSVKCGPMFSLSLSLSLSKICTWLEVSVHHVLLHIQ